MSCASCQSSMKYYHSDSSSHHHNKKRSHHRHPREVDPHPPSQPKVKTYFEPPKALPIKPHYDFAVYQAPLSSAANSAAVGSAEIAMAMNSNMIDYRVVVRNLSGNSPQAWISTGTVQQRNIQRMLLAPFYYNGGAWVSHTQAELNGPMLVALQNNNLDILVITSAFPTGELHGKFIKVK